MGILRKASKETVQLNLDETDYIEVKKDLAQGDFEKLVEKIPQEAVDGGGLTPTQGLAAAKLFFELFVVGWSLPKAPTIAQYDELTPEATRAISEKLVEHFNSLPLNNQESKKPTT